MPTPPETPGRARVIAIANQKGGVGKSTTAVSLGAALADLGYSILVVDLDPQGNASTGLGIKHEARDATVYDVVVGESSLESAVVETQVERLHAIPATIDLAGAEIELVSQFSRESRLKKALEPVREGVYDFIILDCPPSLGLLTVNALTAAEELIVPIQCEYYALEGLGQLLRNVGLVQQNINPSLQLTGIVMTMFDSRTRLSEQVVQEVRRFFGELVYNVIIPRTVRLSEAPGFGQPITVYDPRSKGAETYRELAREVALRPRPDTPMPSIEELAGIVVGSAEGPEPTHGSDGDPIPASELGESAEEETSGDSPATIAPDPTGTPPSHEGSADAEDRAHAPRQPPQIAVGHSPPEAPSEPPFLGEAETVPEPAQLVDDDIWEDAVGPGEPEHPIPPPVYPPAVSGRRFVVIDEHANELRDVEPTQPRGVPPGGDGHDAVTPIGATLEHEGDPPKRRWRLFRKGGDG